MTSAFPVTRLRRFRRTAALRSLVRETRLSLDDFVHPLFVCPGEGVERPLEGLPGIAQRSVDRLCEEAEAAHRAGVRAVLLFGIPEEKDEVASGAYDDDGVVQQALRALRECELDLAEGADAIMVKPALPYLDVLRAARERFDVPLFAYNVSGEYAMVKAAAERGWLDERQAAVEGLLAIKRAGADVIVSYWTRELAEWL